MTIIHYPKTDEIEIDAFVRSSPVSTSGDSLAADATFEALASREPGDELNRFLLCAAVSRSAKSIKARAEKVGQFIPLRAIVRSVLRVYRLAAEKERGLFAGPEINMAKVEKLNDRVLREEIARHCQDKVRNNQAQLARASHDDPKIKTLREEIDQAIADRDRLTARFR